MNKFTSQFHADISAIIARVTAALAEDYPPAPPEAQSRFARLAKIFQLKTAECDLLHCLIACHTNPGLHHRYAEHAGYPHVTEHLVRSLFGHDPDPIYASDSPLNIWQLVHARDMGPGQPVALELDLAVLEWLAGKPGLEPRLIRRLTRPVPVTAALNHSEAVLAPLIDAMAMRAPVICMIDAAESADVDDVLAAITRKTGVAIWCVRDGTEPLTSLDVLKLHRFAHVQGAGLFWAKATQDCLDPVLVPPVYIQCAPRRHSQRIVAPAGTVTVTIDVPAVPRAELHGVLQAKFPQECPHALRRAAAVKGLTARAILDGAHDSLSALVTAQINRNAETLRDWAVPLPSRMGFDDLVLEPALKASLRGFVAEIRAHADLWQNAEVARVYAQERALTALLQGPPGTGKTLTARVLAAEAGMPLYRVDAASLTSKYIGETAENMRALFAAANQSGAMLFIDEFDAIVGKRTETRNEIARSYNHDTAYFLQLIETQFDGVAIFASNRPMDIDAAMHRRIRKVFDFQLPDKDERKALWQLALQPFDASDQVIAYSALLADTFALTGSRIKAVVLNAVALAPEGTARVEIAHLRTATFAEARANGRLPARRELQHLENFGPEPVNEAMT